MCSVRERVAFSSSPAAYPATHTQYHTGGVCVLYKLDRYRAPTRAQHIFYRPHFTSSINYYTNCPTRKFGLVGQLAVIMQLFKHVWRAHRMRPTQSQHPPPSQLHPPSPLSLPMCSRCGVYRNSGFCIFSAALSSATTTNCIHSVTTPQRRQFIIYGFYSLFALTYGRFFIHCFFFFFCFNAINKLKKVLLFYI